VRAWSEIQPEELAAAAAAGEPLQILDVRLPGELAGGHIELGDRFVNLPGSRLFALGDPAAAGLDRGRPVTVVCAHGVSSRPVAAFLAEWGFEARSLAGGMAAWMLGTIARELAPPPGFDRLLQFDRFGKGALGYLLVSDGEAFVVDPSRRIAPLVAAAERAGARLIGVADTHVHADYLSGGPALARQLRVPYHLHPADHSDPYDGRPGRLEIAPLADGAALRVGRGALRIAHTPGHTAGSVTLFAGESVALVGDFVFLRSLGRPDLAGRAAEWTELLWASLERARRDWPAALAVYPAHYASEDERRADGSVGGVWGELQLANEPLALRDRGAFTAWVAARCTTYPAAYRRIKAANVGLLRVGPAEAEELELGRNECALA
jgi:glyoxylase-like metal-dependent hydrolase (beta-lactamase superfamily II)